MTVLDGQLPPTEPPEGERSTRRLLVALLLLLGLLVLALLVGLIWILWPQPSEGVEAIDTSACPMDVEAVLYGDVAGDVGYLVQPLAATLDDRGEVWVSDTGNSRLLVLTRGGQLVRTVGDEDGPGRLVSPNGLAIDATADRVYVADWTRGEVVVFTGQGRYVESLPGPEQDLSVFGEHGFSPFDVELEGRRVVVASNDGVYAFDDEGLVVERWGGDERGSAPGEFDFPNGVAVDGETGHVYVADSLNRRVVALDAEGAVRWISGRPDQEGEIVGFWQLPRSITLGPDGNLYVVDTFRFQEDCAGTGHVVVLSPEGDLVSEFWGAGPDDAQLHFPEKLTVAGDRFVLADREKGRVLVFGLRNLPDPDRSEVNLYERSFERFEGAQVDAG